MQCVCVTIGRITVYCSHVQWRSSVMVYLCLFIITIHQHNKMPTVSTVLHGFQKVLLALHSHFSEPRNQTFYHSRLYALSWFVCFIFEGVCNQKVCQHLFLQLYIYFWKFIWCCSYYLSSLCNVLMSPSRCSLFLSELQIDLIYVYDFILFACPQPCLLFLLFSLCMLISNTSNSSVLDIIYIAHYFCHVPIFPILLAHPGDLPWFLVLLSTSFPPSCTSALLLSPWNAVLIYIYIGQDNSTDIFFQNRLPVSITYNCM